MKSIYILLRTDGTDYSVFIDLSWQRQLYQDSVHRFILIQSLHHLQQLLLGGLLRHGDDLRLDTYLAAGFVFVAHIYL